jgi:hypothetical protein
MFKRLADRVTSAVASVTASSPSPVDVLKSMGFSDADARRALQVNNGNVEQAAEWLLTSTTNDNGIPTAMQATTAQTENDELQEAISASLEEAAQRPPQSAASKRAGQAALSRFDTDPTKNKTTKGPTKPKPRTNPKATPASTMKMKPAGTSTANTITFKTAPLASHPNVKVPKRLSQHDKEDQILRCANRIAPHPMAVDTLLKSLTQLQKHPSDPKYKTIDTSSSGFQRSLNAPGVLDYFKAMNYHVSYRNPLVLELAMLDPATLYLGISALEQVQQTNLEYREAKDKIAFDKEIHAILALADSDMQEAVKRSEYMSKCPSEPTMGGGYMTVELGSATTKKISRKFDGDDTLEDVLNWLGGHGSVLPQKLLAQEWFLVDRNHSNSIAYNVPELQRKTLQYIGCWPSGRLAIVPMAPQSNERMPSSSRGLGAAPMEHLKL